MQWKFVQLLLFLIVLGVAKNDPDSKATLMSYGMLNSLHAELSVMVTPVNKLSAQSYFNVVISRLFIL